MNLLSSFVGSHNSSMRCALVLERPILVSLYNMSFLPNSNAKPGSIPFKKFDRVGLVCCLCMCWAFFHSSEKQQCINIFVKSFAALRFKNQVGTAAKFLPYVLLLSYCALASMHFGKPSDRKS